MNLLISIPLLIVGIVLMVFGFMAIDSFKSDISRFFTGAPTDKAVWLLIAGSVLSLIGVSAIVLR